MVDAVDGGLGNGAGRDLARGLRHALRAALVEAGQSGRLDSDTVTVGNINPFACLALQRGIVDLLNGIEWRLLCVAVCCVGGLGWGLGGGGQVAHLLRVSMIYFFGWWLADSGTSTPSPPPIHPTFLFTICATQTNRGTATGRPRASFRMRCRRWHARQFTRRLAWLGIATTPLSEPPGGSSTNPYIRRRKAHRSVVDVPFPPLSLHCHFPLV